MTGRYRHKGEIFETVASGATVTQRPARTAEQRTAAAMDAEADQWEQLRKGASLPLIEGWTRDGLFDQDDMFLVYERADLEALAKLVQAAMAVTP